MGSVKFSKIYFFFQLLGCVDDIREVGSFFFQYFESNGRNFMITKLLNVMKILYLCFIIHQHMNVLICVKSPVSTRCFYAKMVFMKLAVFWGC